MELVLSKIKVGVEEPLLETGFYLQKIDLVNKELVFLYTLNGVKIYLFLGFLNNNTKPFSVIHVEYSEVGLFLKKIKAQKVLINKKTFIIHLERLIHDSNDGLFWNTSLKKDFTFIENSKSVEDFISFFNDKYIDVIKRILNDVNSLTKADNLINNLAIDNNLVKGLNYSPFLLHQMLMGLIIGKVLCRADIDFLKSIYKKEVDSYDKSIEEVDVFYKILDFI